jgi:hypothetical protein
MVGSLMIDELEMTWNEAALIQSRYYARIFLEELRENTNILSRDSRCPGGDWNRQPPEYKSKTSSLRQSI